MHSVFFYGVLGEGVHGSGMVFIQGTLSHLQGRLGDSIHGFGMLFILILMTVCTLSLFPKRTRVKMHGCSILFPRQTRDKMHGSNILFILIQGTKHSPLFKAVQSPEPGSDPQPMQYAERAN